ncbi:MAG: tetratricopeptide repeat protein [Bryobacteraceae bacterium]
MRGSVVFFLALTLAAGQSDELARESQRARQMMMAGQFESAIPIYLSLVKALPGETGLRLNLALAEHMAGHEAESIPNFEAVLKVQPDALPALISLGAARLALHQPAEAIAPLEKAVTVEPDNRDAQAMLAGACMDSGRFEEASLHFRKLTSLAPREPRGWYGLGASNQAMSARALDRLQKRDPQSPYLAVLLADARAAQRQYRGAFALYKDALQQLPNLHGIHTALAEVYRKTGHADWAAVEEAKERALPPADCKAHPVECDFLAGKDAQALTAPRPGNPSPEALFWQAKAAGELAFQAFFQLGQLPPSVELHQFRAETARDRRQPLESVKEWRAALELAPANPRLKRELAVSLFLAKDYQAAVDEASGFLKMAPRDAELNFAVGDSLLRLEQLERAVPYLRAALAANPKLLPADASLGLALSRMGKTAEAIPHLEKALALDDDGSLHYQLARAYQSAGRQDQARTEMAAYQAILQKSEDRKQDAVEESGIGPPQ